MEDRDQACSSASSCSGGKLRGCPSKGGGATSFRVDSNASSNPIKHVIGIVSGKEVSVGVSCYGISGKCACEERLLRLVSLTRILQGHQFRRCTALTALQELSAIRRSFRL